jgi:RimJ/RimL family protein N-acetyltransferase
MEGARGDRRLPVGADVTGGPAVAPSRTPLDGAFASLVPVDAREHAAALYAASHGTAEVEDAVWTYLPYGPFPDEAAMRTWLGSLEPSVDPLFLTVLDRGRHPVGVVSFLNVDAAMRRVELGHIWYVPAVQRTKVNTETVYLMLRRSFDELGNRRVEWKCDALNARSRAAAERLGFTFEGVFRQHMIVKGRNRDTAWFSILDHEWPGVRTAMERWLQAEPGTSSLTDLVARERRA